MHYFPLGGINADNMLDYLQLDNVCAVGGSWIVDQQLVAVKDWDGITAKASAVCAALAGLEGSLKQ
jgi:2-dehydro-3-deoxyphosphogluconate aldolase/(4S)-4-hydroxy-2-oxoglutarate aldolase